MVPTLILGFHGFRVDTGKVTGWQFGFWFRYCRNGLMKRSSGLRDVHIRPDPGQVVAGYPVQ